MSGQSWTYEPGATPDDWYCVYVPPYVPLTVRTFWYGPYEAWGAVAGPLVRPDGRSVVAVWATPAEAWRALRSTFGRHIDGRKPITVADAVELSATPAGLDDVWSPGG